MIFNCAEAIDLFDLPLQELKNSSNESVSPIHSARSEMEASGQQKYIFKFTIAKKSHFEIPKVTIFNSQVPPEKTF